MPVLIFENTDVAAESVQGQALEWLREDIAELAQVDVKHVIVEWAGGVTREVIPSSGEIHNAGPRITVRWFPKTDRTAEVKAKVGRLIHNFCVAHNLIPEGAESEVTFDEEEPWDVIVNGEPLGEP